MADKDLKLIVEDAASGGFTEKTLSPGVVAGPTFVGFDANGDLETVYRHLVRPPSYADMFSGTPPTASSTNAVAIGNGAVASAAEAIVGGGKNNTASGIYSSVSGGYANTASGYAGVVVGGLNNTASGNESFVGGGNSNTASGYTGATIGGGGNNVASGYYATVPGGQGAIADKYGQMAHASGYFDSAGDAQTSVLVARGTSSNEYQTELYLDGSSARCVIPTNTTWAFSILVVGRNTGYMGSAAGYKIEGVVENSEGSLNLFTPTVTVLAEYNPAWDATVSVGDLALKVVVTGESGQTIRWVARITLVEVGL